MSRCWESRGCDEEMQSECPHSTTLLDRCPAKCAFVHCGLPHHERTSDPARIFDPKVDRAAAMRETCLYCAFFIRNGPQLGDPAGVE